MAIDKRTRPDEVLIRLRADGIEVAHVAYIEEILEDGVVTFANVLPPVPLALVGKDFSTIIGLINQTALAQVATLSTDLDEARDMIDELRTKIPVDDTAELEPGAEAEPAPADVRTAEP